MEVDSSGMRSPTEVQSCYLMYAIDQAHGLRLALWPGRRSPPMPWKEICAMEHGNAFVHDVLIGLASKAEVCRRYRISRPTGEKWFCRCEDVGVNG
jgi:hypothetical protein